MSGRRRTRTAERRLPGDPSAAELVERIIRVDQAGEYGAVRIYAGQLAVLGKGAAGGAIAEMAAQEQGHLEAFDRLVVERGVRPSALSPFWHLSGFLLGAGTALLGEKAALACTVAVEEVIDEHYRDQAERLGDDEAELRALIQEFRDHEAAHREAALEEGAREAPGYEPLVAAIKAGSRLAIWLAERL